jgi:hypothetical protein
MHHPLRWREFGQQYRAELREGGSIDKRNPNIKNHGQKFTLRLLRRQALSILHRNICNQVGRSCGGDDQRILPVTLTPPRRPSRGRATGNGARFGFEAQLFLAADKLRKNLEPSDYKHVALGLIFLKYISNAFEAKRAALLAGTPLLPRIRITCLFPHLLTSRRED